MDSGAASGIKASFVLISRLLGNLPLNAPPFNGESLLGHCVIPLNMASSSVALCQMRRREWSGQRGVITKKEMKLFRWISFRSRYGVRP